MKRGERIYGASVLDVAPTVLHLFGLPAGADMDGKVLATPSRTGVCRRRWRAGTRCRAMMAATRRRGFTMAFPPPNR